MDLPVTITQTWPSGAVHAAAESSSSAGVSTETKLSGTSSTVGTAWTGTVADESAGWLAQAASSSASSVVEEEGIRMREVCGMDAPGGKGKIYRFMRMKGLTSSGTAAKLGASIQTG